MNIQNHYLNGTWTPNTTTGSLAPMSHYYSRSKGERCAMMRIHGVMDFCLVKERADE